jgi:putative flavoprotein involved in K+ transport
MKDSSAVKQIQTIVIGGGQAGLAVGYHLAKLGLSFVILDANARVGDAWRNRWDSLLLFTPAPFSGLPGMHFPTSVGNFPSKDGVADYLAEYARRFRLPLQSGIKVERLWKEGDRFAMSAGTQRFEADNVVVAMADYQVPRIPEFAGELDPSIVQMHSHAYRNPSQLQPGGVLIVGAGNSGADIGIEVARSHPTWISGKESGHIPWPIESFVARNVLFRLVRFIGHRILSLKTPIGRTLRPKMLHRTTPLVRVKPKDLISAGIERVPKTVGMNHGLPLLSDGRTLEVKNIIWCTGYQHGFPWIDLPIFDHNGDPIHEGGIVHKVPGLYFVGLHFLYAMSSATLVGVGRDAERIAAVVSHRTRQVTRQAPTLAPKIAERTVAAM